MKKVLLVLMTILLIAALFPACLAEEKTYSPGDSVTFVVILNSDTAAWASVSIKADTAFEFVNVKIKSDVAAGTYSLSFHLSEAYDTALGDAACTIGGSASITVVTECGHANIEEKTVKEASCMETGEKQTVCTDCGEVLSSEEIAALGHDWDEGSITKEATAAEAGIKTYHCRRCDETRTEEVPYEAESEPKYNIEETSYDKEDMLLTGTVEHDAGTDTADTVFARITFFMSDGTFVAFATVIDENGNFEAMASGDIVHIAVQVTDSTKVRPGQYNAYSGKEFDVE